VTPGLVARLGMAIVAPRRALAIAGARRHAGRAGGDLLVALLVLVVATELRGLVAAGWIAGAVDIAFGLRAALDVVARAVTIELGAIVVVALGLWLAAGPRRDIGRAFDLACACAVPLVAVALVATVATRVADVVPPAPLGGALAIIACAWCGAVTMLAVPVARGVAADPGGGARAEALARRAGLALAAVAALGVVAEVAWIARNGDLVRPMRHGDRAPALALHAIGPRGELGAIVTLPEHRPVVVDFWATWCGPCLRALPRLEAFARAHPEATVIAVNVDDPKDARDTFDHEHYAAMSLVAGDKDTETRYGVTSYPHTVVIDRGGDVVKVARGGAEIDLEKEIRSSSASFGQ
jgi:thiol-disulfide isomerase/thioredoxin